MDNNALIINCCRLKRAVLGWNEADLSTSDESVVDQVNAALATLPPREAEVLRMRFGIGVPVRSLEEIGQKIDARLFPLAWNIRRIEAKAIRKLRHWTRKSIWQKEPT